jgi:hypothetical protein
MLRVTVPDPTRWKMDSLRMQSHAIVRTHQEELLAEARAERLSREGRVRPAPRGIRLTVAGLTRGLLGGIGVRRRPDPWLTPYACRLPNGEMGRAAAVFIDGEWTLVCRPAG